MPVYRTIQLDTLDALRDVSVQAERAYLRLALGRFSSRTGIVKYNARDLAAEARLRPSELEAALVELERAGHILRAENAPALYLLGFCSAFAPRPLDNRRSWLVEIGGCKYANLAAQAMKEIEDAMPTGGPVGGQRVSSAYPVAPLQEQDQEQDQNRIRNSTPLPTVAAPTGAKAPANDASPQLDLGDRTGAVSNTKPTISPEVQQLIDAYLRLCPSMPKVRANPKSVVVRDARSALKRDPDLSVWEERFRRAEMSDFLTGRAKDRQFKADLLWLLNAANVEKLDFGRYDNRGKPGMMTHAPVYTPPEPAKVYPYYAKSGKGLDAPEFYDPEYGWTDMTEARWKETGDALPF